MSVTSTVVKVLSLDLGCNVIMKSVFRESSYQKGKGVRHRLQPCQNHPVNHIWGMQCSPSGLEFKHNKSESNACLPVQYPFGPMDLSQPSSLHAALSLGRMIEREGTSPQPICGLAATFSALQSAACLLPVDVDHPPC